MSAKLTGYRTITLESSGKSFPAGINLSIKEALENEGIRFSGNCNGKGKCLSCRVQFLSEPPDMTELEARLFDTGSDYRMACQHNVLNDIHILLPFDDAVHYDKSLSDFRIKPVGSGYGIAVDLGTTTVALYVANLENGEIVAQRTFLNPQLAYGGDVMTRIEFASDYNGKQKLHDSIHDRITSEIEDILQLMKLEKSSITKLVIAANSVMSQFWRGYDGEGLARVPFRSILEERGFVEFDPMSVGLPTDCQCRMLPVLASFIGGDITAAILAANLQDAGVRLLIDLGTNGEVVLTVNGEIYAASTAAGPAFEGIGMSSGMPAVTGAVFGLDDELKPLVTGNVKPLGFCGSGYIAAIAALLSRGTIAESGLMRPDKHGERRWSVNSDASLPPFITQDDVRKFQLAKGAIAAGIEILCDKAGVQSNRIDGIILTGSFGNRIDPGAAMRVGLIPESVLDRITFIDNAAGRGAAMCLTDVECIKAAIDLQKEVKVINLGELEQFQDRFVANMNFRKFSK